MFTIDRTSPVPLSKQIEASLRDMVENRSLPGGARLQSIRQLATQLGHDRDATIGAMGQQQGSQSGDMARRAKEWLAVYRVALGLPDPDKKGANTNGKPAGAVVSWGARRVRGRFYSYGG